MSDGPERAAEPSDTAGIKDLLAPLMVEPDRSAVLLDVDGTLAPIVDRPGDAAVPPQTVELLRRIAERFALVGCVSGRRTLDARRMVGLDSVAYAGNHGYELLAPGAEAPELHPLVAERADVVPVFVTGLDRAGLEAGGVRFEDKGPIQALHWRGAGDPEAAERLVLAVAADAEDAGLHTHRGRMVLELRPVAGIDKGLAVAALIERAERRVDAGALYAGDDRTDLDAFRGLRELITAGKLGAAVCVGVASAEGPAEIVTEADLTVTGTAGVVPVLEALVPAAGER